ncbi:glucosyl-dolichyl phosphate glucuronosyltransferase [Halobellus inordinatus]|uniref:glucosyl-dolichyl phosphate glucuronosyltransferase n=1 Tax=Halobellus inordinatus TaxID=1126236 RepID=UPI00210B74F0|nr:glucosyl-dolichyl phosphate glucuronosyltransferase [Halobellus inordinatus]
MDVSVVVCAYDPDQYDDLRDAIESVLAQTYDDVEVVVVIDGSDELYERVQREYGDVDGVVLHCNDSNMGLSRSRNAGIERSSGDVVAFLDDDAIARDDWLAELVDTYERRDAIAAGGRMAPRWVAGEPEWLPPEFYWLVGVTHRGFPEDEREVRNTFGSNISFKRDVFEEVGDFDPNLGRHGDRQIQGEETELSARMYEAFGERVWYNPDAVVEHKVFEYRTDPRWLLERAFWQGYSKRVLEELIDDAGGEEGAFLSYLLFEGLPGYAIETVRDRSVASAKKGLFATVLTAAVGLGFLYALVT